MARASKYGGFGDQNLSLMDRLTADKDGSDTTSNFSIPSTNIEDLEAWLENDVAARIGDGTGPIDRTHFTRRVDDESTSDVNDHIAMGRLGLIRAVRAADPTSFVFAGEHSIPELERLIDQEIRGHLDHPEDSSTILRKRHSDKVPRHDYENERYSLTDLHQTQFLESDKIEFVEFDKTEHNKSDGITFETCEMAPEAKALCYLPWWFIFFSWTLCVGTIIVCLYFTLMYGLHYGYLRSVDWAIGLGLSFLMSLLLIQPLQVFISALILTLFCRVSLNIKILIVHTNNIFGSNVIPIMESVNFRPKNGPSFRRNDSKS
jgi:hypothetical protein